MAPLKLIALIAAAGKSERLGSPKALRPFNGQPAVYFLAHKISILHPQKIFVTLPVSLLGSIEWPHDIQKLPLAIRFNRFPGLGYAGSIKTVFSEENNSDGILITPIDAPYFSKSLLLTLRALATLKTKAIVIPCFFGQKGHPVYLSKDFFFELKTKNYPEGLRSVVKKHESYIKLLFWPEKNILINLNQ